MDVYRLLKLHELNPKEQKEALVFVFSKLYIPTPGEKVTLYSDMIALIEKRFDNKEEMIELFNRFSKAVYKDRSEKLYLFFKNNSIIGYCLQYYFKYAVTNEDELSDMDQHYFSKELNNIGFGI